MSYKRGDVIFVRFPEDALGSEQKGTRPAVILQNDRGNERSTTLVVAAICTQRKKLYPMHYILQDDEGGVKKGNVVLCEQVKTIDKQRILRKLGSLSTATMAAINEKLRIELDL